MNNFTIVIPYFNGHKTIQRLLDSLPKSLFVLIVDDKSDNPNSVYDLSHAGLSILQSDKKGYFTGAVNRGIEACNTDILILNQDTYFTGPKWLDMIDEALDTYDLIGEGITGNHPAWSQGYIHGTFMYITKRVIDTIGLLNEVDYPLWGSTCEYQLRACRQGFNALPLPNIPDFHHRDKRQKYGDAINTILEREPTRQREFIKTPPEVSIVIPNYNYGRYLPEAINSLMAQTFQSFEVVIVDDASTDISRDIIQSLVDPWKGIRAIYLPKNVGTAQAINKGIEASYGRYISILSADDMMKPDRLDNLYRLQLQNPHSFIYDDLVPFGQDAYRMDGVRKQGDEYILPLPLYDFEELLMKNGVHAGIFYPRQAWVDAGGYPALMGRGREDWGFNVALGLKGWCGVKLDTPGYLYRREGQNRTLTNTDIDSRRKFLGKMLELYPDIYRGVRPMGCCGNSKIKYNGSGETVSKINAVAGALPGREGFEILEYIGSNVGDMTWYGPESRTRYIFGGNRRVGYVDKRDVVKMVALLDQGKKVFRVYHKTVETKPLVEVKEETILPFDPSELSVNQIKARLDTLSDKEIEALIEAEKAGLNRKGAIGVLEAVNA